MARRRSIRRRSIRDPTTAQPPHWSRGRHSDPEPSVRTPVPIGMTHQISPDDVQFRQDFEAGRLSPADFDHRAHVRLAYVYLVEADDAAASDRMRSAILTFLDHHAIEVSKYHETMTRAWLLAVRHFMERTPEVGSAEAFIEATPLLLDSGIMMSHYSTGLLFSDRARADFVEPDLDGIPRYDP